jgi:hypothetical protein
MCERTRGNKTILCDQWSVMVVVRMVLVVPPIPYHATPPYLVCIGEKSNCSTANHNVSKSCRKGLTTNGWFLVTISAYRRLHKSCPKTIWRSGSNVAFACPPIKSLTSGIDSVAWHHPTVWVIDGRLTYCTSIPLIPHYSQKRNLSQWSIFLLLSWSLVASLPPVLPFVTKARGVVCVGEAPRSPSAAQQPKLLVPEQKRLVP